MNFSWRLYHDPQLPSQDFPNWFTTRTSLRGMVGAEGQSYTLILPNLSWLRILTQQNASWQFWGNEPRHHPKSITNHRNQLRTTQYLPRHDLWTPGTPEYRFQRSWFFAILLVYTTVKHLGHPLPGQVHRCNNFLKTVLYVAIFVDFFECPYPPSQKPSRASNSH